MASESILSLIVSAFFSFVEHVPAESDILLLLDDKLNEFIVLRAELVDVCLGLGLWILN